MILLISLLLIPAAWMFAQYGGYERQGGGYEERRGGDQGNVVSVEGCVFGEPGNLALLDDSGNTYELRGRTGPLNNFIGHRVRVDGRTWFRADNPYAMSDYGEATPILRVYGTQRISRGHCDQWGGADTEFRFSIPIH
jgi:hypothetical protein